MPAISRYFDADLDMWIPSALARYWGLDDATSTDVDTYDAIGALSDEDLAFVLGGAL